MKLLGDDKNQKKNSRVRLPLYVYLSYLLIATFLFTGVSFSKYATSGSAQSGARVAAFSVSVAGEETEALVLDISGDVQSSDSYSFSVSSDSEVLVSDVITVTLPAALPEGITMYMTVNDVVSEPICNGNTYTYSQNFEMGKDTHTWTLVFSADPNTLNLAEDFSLDNITIHVEATQID